MTQAPIEPRHKDMAANMLSQSYDRILTIAQTLANLEASRAENKRLKARLEVVDGWSEDADGIACRDDTIKLQDARIEDMRADLAEIDRIAKRNHWDEAANETFLKIAAIAAPYRASDPVAEALKDVLIALGVGPDECVASKWDAGVAKFRAFIEGER